jgi:hypothetical protein
VLGSEDWIVGELQQVLLSALRLDSKHESAGKLNLIRLAVGHFNVLPQPVWSFYLSPRGTVAAGHVPVDRQKSI